MVSIPILLAFLFCALIYKAKQDEKNVPFNYRLFGVSFLLFLSVGLLLFIRKPHTTEFNCWYYIEDHKEEFKITFATSPEHILETTMSSPNLNSVIEKEAMTDEYRDGYYCPETRVRVITRFKEVVGLEISGFRNSKIDKVITFEKPFPVEINTITGDQTFLEPTFTLGD